MFKCINEKGGHFYVCGDVSMAADVCNTIEMIVSEQGNMTPEQAKSYVISLRVSKILKTVPNHSPMGDFWDAWWQQTCQVKSVVFGHVRMLRTT